MGPPRKANAAQLGKRGGAASYQKKAQPDTYKPHPRTAQAGPLVDRHGNYHSLNVLTAWSPRMVEIMQLRPAPKGGAR